MSLLLDIATWGLVWLVASVVLGLLLGMWLSWDRRFYDAWDDRELFDWAEDEDERIDHAV